MPMQVDERMNIYDLDKMEKLKYKEIKLPYTSVNGRTYFYVKTINKDVLGNSNPTMAFDNVRDHVIKLETLTKAKKGTNNPLYVDIEGLIIKLIYSYRNGKNKAAKEFLDFLECKINEGEITYELPAEE